MKLELLISAVNADAYEQIKKKNIDAEAVLINQCGKDGYEEFENAGKKIRVFSYDEKGVGVSRNHAIENAKGDILLFSDDDIVYVDDLERLVLSEFEKHEEADGLFFNVEVNEDRRTYWNTDYKRCSMFNSGRYPAYSIAIRRTALEKAGVKYSTLFGGGAKYSCGEDSLFIKELIASGVRMYRTPLLIGREEKREGGASTWFNGYNEKYFFDRGVLYHFLYGRLAWLFGLRYVYLKRNIMCREIPWKKAFRLLISGVKQGKAETDER